VSDILGLPGQECDRRLQTARAGSSARCGEKNRKAGAKNNGSAQETSQQTGEITPIAALTLGAAIQPAQILHASVMLA